MPQRIGHDRRRQAPKVMGCHYHDVIAPAWFGLWDFKALLLRKPGGAPLPAYKNSQGYRWYSQK